MLEMYKGVANSPETTITNNINESDTLIYVLDETRVPEPPNLMVLGTGTSAETVKVISIDGNALTVERGFQGVARSWNAGTVIARNFTEYDYNALVENVKTLKENIAAHKAETVTGIFNVVTGYDADPTGTNDSTIAIQNAIDACYSAGGGIVYLPRGTYKISAPLIMKSGVSLIGAGGFQESEILNSSNGVAISFPNTSTYMAVRLMDFSIKGDTDGGFSPTYGIDGANFRTHCIIERVRIWCHQHGVRLDDCWYSLYRNIYTNTTSTAIELTTANGVVVENCILHGVDDVNAYVLTITGANISIRNNYFENSNVARVIAVYNSYTATIENNYMENITSPNGIFVGNSRQVMVLNNYLLCNVASGQGVNRGIRFYNTDGGFIANNDLIGCTEYTLHASGSNNIVIGSNYLDESDGAVLGISSIMWGTQRARMVTRGGSTAYRPSDPVVYEMYFDSTLAKPIWYDGTNWVDATGTTV